MSFMAAYRAGNPGLFSAAAPTDTDVVTWAAAVVTNGGTVSVGRTSLVSTLVATWKEAGTWAVIDDAWLLVAENSQQALTSLKQRRLATAVAAPTFTVDRGYAFNGTTQYIDTLFVPSVNKVAMAGTNIHIAAYERTNVAAAGFAAGAYNFSDRAVVMAPRLVAGQMSLSLNSTPLGPGGDVIADSRGLSVGSRNGTLAADVLAYRNGVTVVPWQVGTISAVLTTSKLFIGCRSDNVNAPAAFRAATEGFVSVGAAIPAAQQPAFYSAIQNFMTATGANV